MNIYKQFIEHLTILRRAGIRGSRITFSNEGLTAAMMERSADFCCIAASDTFGGLPYTVERDQASLILVHE